MSNTNLELSNLQAKYAQIIELKKKQVELRFTPQANKQKDYVKSIRNLRSQIARLQRYAAKLRAGIELTEAEEAAAQIMQLEEKKTTKTKKGKK